MFTETLQNNIRGFIDKTGLTSKEITFEVSENGKTLWCKIYTDDGYLFLGRGGEGLSALNHLVHKIVERELPQTEQESYAVIVDINNFQKKKIENLKTIAHMMAERARFFKSSVEVDPMPPFDRRIIHEFLSEMSDIQTESTGMGPHRRVVIKYVSPQI